MERKLFRLTVIVVTVIMLIIMFVANNVQSINADESPFDHRDVDRGILKTCELIAPDNLHRWYILDLPDNENWNDETLSPVVMFFHGGVSCKRSG